MKLDGDNVEFVLDSPVVSSWNRRACYRASKKVFSRSCFDDLLLPRKFKMEVVFYDRNISRRSDHLSFFEEVKRENEDDQSDQNENRLFFFG